MKKFLSKKRMEMLLFLFVTLMSLSSCTMSAGSEKVPSGSSEVSPGGDSREDIGVIVTNFESFDSADTAIFMSRDEEKRTVTLWNLAVSRTYTLSYDGTTKLSDKYGESISLAQVAPGDVVDVTFLKSKKHLTELKLSPQVWSLEQVSFFSLDGVRSEATVGQDGKKLKLTVNTQFFSEGRPIDMTEISDVDVLSFQGIDKEVLSVRVEKGHGYLRLSGQEKFVGGWLEIGQSQIRRITEEMLLPLTEGSYRVTVSKDGNGGEKTAVIRKNEETVVDISDLEVAEPETGTILFTLSPTSAKLYVDGEKVDASLPVTLVYGIHQLIIKADGYQTLTQYVRVGQPSAGLDISLDPVREGDDADPSEGADVATDYAKVYVDAPAGVEVYLDGSYMGTSPCSFQKEAGSHVILLRRSGFVPKSYTVSLDSEKKDISYSFADLESYGTLTESGSGATDLNSIISGVFDNLLD